ncbi:MAG: Multidrug resistance protein MdtA [Chlamydiales bacterium]|nr:Multidrug resistance protein MdtA [Chlamydiales bacterium]
MKKSKILIFGLCVFIVGCSQKEQEHPSYPVEIGEVREEDVPEFIKGVGQLVPSISVDIKAQVGGYLTNVLFTDGQKVEANTLLMTIDPRIYEAKVSETKAQLAENQAKLRYALDFAETYGELVGKEYVSRLEYEQAVQNVDSYKAAVELDMAAVKKAEVDLSFTQLRAPFKGYLGLRTFDPGNYVDALADTSLVTINRVTPISVEFYLPSMYVQEIRERQNKEPLYLEAEIPNQPAQTLSGALWFIDNTINEKTGMILLEGNIPNEDEIGWPGQFVRVYLRLQVIKDAIVVPKQAVVLGQNGSVVYVLDEKTMTVEMRMIGKGLVYKDSIVALWGLKPGEKVIIDGQLNLYPGAKVHIPNDKG